jgi:acetamidase/formamidase
MATHRLAPTPETVRWGSFDAAYPPLITINSGDTVVLECVSGGAEVMPPPASGLRVPPALAAIHAANIPRVGGHILTGPVAVAGAQPGDMLEVHIDRIELGADWGYCGFRPLLGTLPEDFPERFLSHIPVDRDRRMALLPWGTELPLAPFFGVMGVAPPLAWGRITSIVPRAMGGNLDNKELVAGATLYLPVFREGALFSCGDGHGVQGDGEVCVTAIETSLQGRFQFIARNDLRFSYPRAETPTHYITMGMDPDLDQCSVMALRDMIVLLGEKANLSREDAYTLCSLAADVRVTQAVNGSKGIHVMIEKKIVHPTAA